MNMNNPPRSKVPSAPASASPSHSCGGSSSLPPRSKVSEAGGTSPSASSPRSKVPSAPVPSAPVGSPNCSSSDDVAIKAHYLCLSTLYKSASEAYYKFSSSPISDADFDALSQRLTSMRQQHPCLFDLPDPTAKVVSDHVDGFQKVVHSYPMLSLEDIYTEEELTKFVNSTGDEEYSVECKLDGLSLSLIYEQGKLVRAVTRGNGTEGDDVTAQARCIPSIPQELVLDGYNGGTNCEIRGEVVMPWTAFNAYNDACTNDKDKFANPRNAASGTLKSHDPNKCRERGLLFVAYYLFHNKFDGYQNYGRGESGSLGLLSCFGFKTPADYNAAVTLKRTADFGFAICDMHNQEYPFPIDGIVIKCNSQKMWQTLGYTDRFYKWGIAFKFRQDSIESKLVRVDWQVAESGRVTPVAIYEPIQMYGTTCQRATLNNPQWIEQNLPGIRIGDTLLLTKGGEIIPKVTGFIPHELTQHEKNMELVTPRQWTETIGSPIIAQTFGKVVPPDIVNGKGTYRNGAYLQVDVDPKPTDGAPTKRVNESPKVTGSSLRGKTILVSGNFGTPQIRKDIERTVVEQGGTLANGVTLSVDYYVLPDNLDDWKRKAGSKWTKIQSYMHQSRIITKEQFYSLIH